MRPAPQSLLALCGVAVLLAACESAPVTGRSQMMLVSESEELKIGPAGLSAGAFQGVAVLRWRDQCAGREGRPAHRRGRRTAAQRSVAAPHFRWEFKTVDKNEPNAFCLPGGKVVVYSGILPISKTEPDWPS